MTLEPLRADSLGDVVAIAVVAVGHALLLMFAHDEAISGCTETPSWSTIHKSRIFSLSD